MTDREEIQACFARATALSRETQTMLSETQARSARTVELCHRRSAASSRVAVALTPSAPPPRPPEPSSVASLGLIGHGTPAEIEDQLLLLEVGLDAPGGLISLRGTGSSLAANVIAMGHLVRDGIYERAENAQWRLTPRGRVMAEGIQRQGQAASRRAL